MTMSTLLHRSFVMLLVLLATASVSATSATGQQETADPVLANAAQPLSTAATRHYVTLRPRGTYEEKAPYRAALEVLIYREQIVTAPDGVADDWFGWSLALDGDTALVGAPLVDSGENEDEGAAYVFTRSGGSWSFEQELTAPDGEAWDNFGRMVALDGETAIVAAPLDDSGANENQGSAYVFTRSGTTWSFQQKLTAPDGKAGDIFGMVALDGDTALVAAGGDIGQGAVYVFTRSGASWSFQQKLTAPDGEAGDIFGGGVALDGDTALVGAPWDDIEENEDQGSAYVFTRSGTTWAFQEQLLAPDGSADDWFGMSLALDGDTALIGAPYHDSGENADQGAAYVFTRSGASWSFQQKLTASDGAAGDDFGYAVALDGNTVLVGAPYDDSGGNEDQGAAYVFTRSGASWSFQQKLTASDGEAGDIFGAAVALARERALVGAPWDDIEEHGDRGSAYLYEQVNLYLPLVLRDA
jgi:hypothetical protein